MSNPVNHDLIFPAGTSFRTVVDTVIRRADRHKTIIETLYRGERIVIAPGYRMMEMEYLYPHFKNTFQSEASGALSTHDWNTFSVRQRIQLVQNRIPHVTAEHLSAFISDFLSISEDWRVVHWKEIVLGTLETKFPGHPELSSLTTSN